MLPPMMSSALVLDSPFDVPLVTCVSPAAAGVASTQRNVTATDNEIARYFRVTLKFTTLLQLRRFGFLPGAPSRRPSPSALNERISAKLLQDHARCQGDGELRVNSRIPPGARQGLIFLPGPRP